MVGVTSSRTSWNSSTSRRLRAWQASSARTRSRALVAAAPSTTMANTGSICSHARRPARSGVGPEVVDAGQGQPLVDRVVVEDRARPPRPRCPATPAPRPPARRWPAPRHPPRRIRASATMPPCGEAWARPGRRATTPPVGAASADRSDRDRPPRPAPPPRRTDGGPSAPWSTGAASRALTAPPLGTRPSDGFIADRPQHDDGMRSDPPPSDPVASGTMPDGDGRRAPSRGPARAVIEVPRVERRPEQRVVGVRLPSQLRGVGLAHHHAAGGHQPGHQRRVRRRPADRRRRPSNRGW